MQCHVSVLICFLGCRDEFGNVWEKYFDAISSLLAPPALTPTIRPALILPTSAPRFNQYIYNPAAIGEYRLDVSLLEAGGVWATYYQPGLIGAYLSRKDSTIDFSASSSALSLWPGIQSSYLSVRWSGSFRPPANATYTLQATLLGQESRVRLYLDNAVVFDQWSSLALMQPTRSVGRLDSSQFYSVIAEYTRSGFAPMFGIKLSVSVDNSTFSPLANESLFRGFPSQDSPFAIKTFGGSACASTSILSGSSVSLLTAGIVSSFWLQLRDSFGNAAATLSPAKVVALAQYPDPPIQDKGVVVPSPLLNSTKFRVDGGRMNLTVRLYNALARNLIEIGGEARVVEESLPAGDVLVLPPFTVAPAPGAPYVIREQSYLPTQWFSLQPAGLGESLSTAAALQEPALPLSKLTCSLNDKCASNPAILWSLLSFAN